MPLVELKIDSSVALVRLNDPEKRNALSIAMFDALDEAVAKVSTFATVRAVLVAGEGKTFCAGFDLAAAVDAPSLMSEYIGRLSTLMRSLRRLPQPVVIAVQGAAIAGGCALVSAGDFVVVSPNARLGYPVHPIGVSPAVTLPTLEQKLGMGAARALTMGGELIDGETALECGLASHLAPSDKDVLDHALALARDIAAKPPSAVRVTKAWLNELDGSLNDDRFARPADDSAQLAGSEEGVRMLRDFWQRRA